MEGKAQLKGQSRVGTGTGYKGPAATSFVLGPSRTRERSPTEPSGKEPPAFALVLLQFSTWHRLCLQGLHLLALLALSPHYPMSYPPPPPSAQIWEGNPGFPCLVARATGFNRATDPKPQPPWLGIGSSFPLNKIKTLIPPPQGSLPGSL